MARALEFFPLARAAHRLDGSSSQRYNEEYISVEVGGGWTSVPVMRDIETMPKTRQPPGGVVTSAARR